MAVKNVWVGVTQLGGVDRWWPVNQDTGYYVTNGGSAFWLNNGDQTRGPDGWTQTIPDDHKITRFVNDSGQPDAADTINVTIDESFLQMNAEFRFADGTGPGTHSNAGFMLQASPDDTVNLILPIGWSARPGAKHYDDDANPPGVDTMQIFDASGTQIGSFNFAGGTGDYDPPIAGATVGAFYGDVNVTHICFARGTMIRTDRGEVAIEALQEGDLVETLHHGLQPIRWIGSSVKPARGNFAPILIRQGAMGNERDLLVSQQHRMFVSGWKMEMLFASDEALVAAKHLVNDHSIIRVEGGEIEYFHILFDQHEVIYAEGALAESFHPGAEGQKSLSSAQSEEIFAIFPELEGKFDNYGDAGHRVLKAYEGRILAQNPDFLI